MLMVEPSGRTSNTGYCLSYFFLAQRTTDVLFELGRRPVVCNADAATACLLSAFCRHLGKTSNKIRHTGRNVTLGRSQV